MAVGYGSFVSLTFRDYMWLIVHKDTGQSVLSRIMYKQILIPWNKEQVSTVFALLVSQRKSSLREIPLLCDLIAWLYVVETSISQPGKNNLDRNTQVDVQQYWTQAHARQERKLTYKICIWEFINTEDDLGLWNKGKIHWVLDLLFYCRYNLIYPGICISKWFFCITKRF